MRLVRGGVAAGLAPFLLQALALLALCASQAAAKLEVIDLREGGRQLLAQNECAAKGQQGACNGCVCCCYDGGAGIVSYIPSATTCQCERVVNSSQIWATVVLAVIVVLAGLLVQLYFGGSLPISPFPTQQQRRRASSVAPEQPPPMQPQSNFTPAPPAMLL